jgi:hypothetical protein
VQARRLQHLLRLLRQKLQRLRLLRK